MREMRLTPTNNNISFAQLLGMRDHIAFPLGKNINTETEIYFFFINFHHWVTALGVDILTTSVQSVMKFHQNDNISFSVFVKLWWRHDVEILLVFSGLSEIGIFSYIRIMGYFSKLGYHLLIITNIYPNQHLSIYQLGARILWLGLFIKDLRTYARGLEWPILYPLTPNFQCRIISTTTFV